jgi:hypothetical protein
MRIFQLKNGEWDSKPLVILGVLGIKRDLALRPLHSYNNNNIFYHSLGVVIEIIDNPSIRIF